MVTLLPDKRKRRRRWPLSSLPYPLLPSRIDSVINFHVNPRSTGFFVQQLIVYDVQFVEISDDIFWIYFRQSYESSTNFLFAIFFIYNTLSSLLIFFCECIHNARSGAQRLTYVPNQKFKSFRILLFCDAPKILIKLNYFKVVKISYFA